MCEHHDANKSALENSEYFNDNPHDGIDLSSYLIGLLEKINPKRKGTFLEIGAGVGRNLTKIKDRVERVVAIDVSSQSLEICANRIQCEVKNASILDEQFVDAVDVKADFVLLSCVLHHLVGTTRKQSFEFSRKGILNSLKLLNSGGYLIVMEPNYQPHEINTLVFYLKRFGAFVTRGKRLGIFGFHNNLGAPVVSYFNKSELTDLLSEFDLEKYDEWEWKGSLSRLQKLGLIKEFSLIHLVYRKK